MVMMFKFKKSSDQTPGEQVSLGVQSKTLKNNPAFHQAIEELKEEMFECFKRTGISNPGDRETLYYTMNGMDLFINRLDILIQRMENIQNINQTPTEP